MGQEIIFVSYCNPCQLKKIFWRHGRSARRWYGRGCRVPQVGNEEGTFPHKSPNTCMQGRRHEISTGGGADSDCGDGFSWVKTTYPQIPISPRISPTLVWQYWKIWKFWQIFRKFSLMVGNIPSRISNRGDTSSLPPPPGGDARACMIFFK